MAANTRTHGANARQVNWDEDERRAPQRTGSWLPLEALDEDDPIYAGTPQLRAMPAPGQVAIPQRTRQHELAPTMPQPARAARPARAGSAGRPAERVVPASAIAMAGGVMLAAVAAYLLLSAAVGWAQVRMDDLQYGRPRTVQLDAYVGQNEAQGVPSHFIAMNLNRRVTIFEMQGGDPTKVNTIVGPYLFGEGEDLTPVQLAAQDLNGDNKADLVVSVKNEQLLYLNDGSTFKLATPEERAAIEKKLSAPKANQSVSTNGAANQGATTNGGVNK